ncbi:hypothetical protein MHB77_19650 [Paenibacillus sp. FSL K6-3166]|uniref:hypothetical protein n=1 Tax=Paenibacillus sp. FSL K6-3166 TaxID=2921492 RepID=UPI0030F588B7
MSWNDIYADATNSIEVTIDVSEILNKTMSQINDLKLLYKRKAKEVIAWKKLDLAALLQSK